MIPIMCSENNIITEPAKILRTLEFFNKNWPMKVAAAPKIINTIENPKVKKIIGIKLTFCFSISSFSELPDIYEI